MYRRKKSRSAEINEELSAGVSHLRNAASGAAEIAKEKLGEVRESLSERRQQAKENLGPIIIEQRDKASRRARKAWDSARKAAAAAERKAERGAKAGRKRGTHRRRWPVVVGLLAVGAAIGAVGNIAARKARQTDWDEFDVREQATNAKNKLSEVASTAKGKAAEAAATAKDKASEFANSVKQKTAAKAAATQDALEEVGVATGKAVDAAKASADTEIKKLAKSESKAPVAAGSRNGRGTN